MPFVRPFFPVLLGCLLWAVQLGAQNPAGTITGRVVDAATQQPLSGANVLIEGTSRGTLTRADGGFLLTGVPAGTHQVRASLIGYGSNTETVAVQAGQTATVRFALNPQALQMQEIVAVGYGTQRREAITGSVSTITNVGANDGVIESPTEMIQGRAAGVTVVMNNGEPGAGAQVRIRGGTSISASNEPLYVIDGVPINNVATEPGGRGISGSEAALPRNPLNLLNPNDIESISILKDASATAIYGSRGANGVVLITTKKGGAGGNARIEYEGNVGMATPYRQLDLLNGEQYRQFVQQQVQAGTLGADRLAGLGTANTDWEDEITRNAVTQNHNLSFAGGSETTKYRASLNYLDQEGVVISNGFKRVQGRLNGTHSAFSDKLRLGLNLNSSFIENDYLPYENTGGFEGGVFTNVAIFNPTRPVTVVDDATGAPRFFETGTGRQTVRNPVALAEQIADLGETTRTLGNVSAELDLLSNLTGSVNLGVDRSEAVRRTYWPRINPVGAEFQGLAQQVQRDNTSLTLQTLLTFREQFAQHGLEVVGGYEYNDYDTGEFAAEARGFLTDAFSFNNLGGGSELVRPWSWREQSRLVSFFSRANYNFRDRYYLTGVVRYDGSSRFGEGNKWAVFPAVSASWRISEESFLRDHGLISDLRLRAGFGLQGNPAVPPYASLITLAPGGNYAFGERLINGIAPNRNPNPNLKWEETAQYNIALDYGLLSNRFSGTIEYYRKNTTDLLLQVAVPQPALVATRLENIGEIKNQGVEASLDAVALAGRVNWTTGLVFAAERNEVVNLGGRSFITTGGVSGQGQSGQVSQRIVPGFALGTFYGPTFVGVNAQGKQLFRCERSDADCVGGQTTSPSATDFGVIGNANPDFTVGFRNQLDWGRFDASFLIRGVFGNDVFNNTALVYGTKGNALQDKNFLASALDDPTGISEPAIYSSRWIEDGSFARLQYLTLGYRLNLPRARTARVYVSGDNLFLLTDYSGYDPEVHTESGLASRGIDYLNYPRPRTFTAGVSVGF
jgi:TonB-linked SusC/RagA family outer membrane protein